MASVTKGSALALGICVVLGLSALGYQLADAAVSVKAMERTVSVKGLSERDVDATTAAWPIRYQVAENDLDKLYLDVEKNQRMISAFLKKHGLSDDEISLAPPVIADAYANQWGDKSQIKFRYTGEGDVTVFTTKVDAVRKAMANLLELGKQGVVVSVTKEDIQRVFSYDNLSKIKPAMIEEATKNARAVAEKFAQDSNSKLGKIKSAQQGQFSINNRDDSTPHMKRVRVVTTVEYYLSD